MFSSNSSQVSAANYIEDVFSTYLYTGSGGEQSIRPGINLSTNGGMVWIKSRNDTTNHFVFDTSRGATKEINSNTTDAEATLANSLTAFTTNGFTVGGATGIGTNNNTYVSWAFRKQAKFFDVVTYTGDGSASPRQIAHSLGSVPGFIVIKRTDTTSDWTVWHRSVTGNAFLQTTDAWQTGFTRITTPDASTFTVGASTAVNASGGTYVAYLFAHNAGGFGAAGTDNVISCGSWTDSGSGTQTITLGYEPQWLIYKRSDDISNWVVIDNMRGWPVVSAAGSTANLYPNLSNAESGGNYSGNGPTATGFNMPTLGGGTYIYIAIRRGPMKTPTSGTSVFSAKTYVGTTTSAEVTHDVTFDAEISANRGTVISKYLFVDSLRGMRGVVLQSASSAVEASYPGYWGRKSQQTMYAPSAFDDWWAATSTNQNHISYGLVRAPGFFDVVCYTGDGASTKTVTHNLGVSPELIIAKKRSSAGDWGVYVASQTDGALLNTTDGFNISNRFTSVGATSFAVRLSGTPSLNDSGATYVAYLFATCPGVSKVGSYTGTAALQAINCGFSAGARFVLIKRTDSTGDWYVYDSARGISSGNDPYLLLNSTAVEVTGTNYVGTTSVGFQVTAAASTTVNVSGGSYIFLAIA